MTGFIFIKKQQLKQQQLVKKFRYLSKKLAQNLEFHDVNGKNLEFVTFLPGSMKFVPIFFYSKEKKKKRKKLEFLRNIENSLEFKLCLLEGGCHILSGIFQG